MGKMIDADLLKEKVLEMFGDIPMIVSENREELFSDVINDIPDAEQEKWVLCSDRLPDENGHYLVTYHSMSYGNFLPLFDNTSVRKMRFRNGKWITPVNIDEEAEKDEFKEVTAWQPLPEPYVE